MDAIRATLQNEGTWLDSDCVVRLSQLMIQHCALAHCVGLIDSICLEAWFLKGRFAAVLTPAPHCRMLLMPVYYAKHWSLLVRCFATRQWLHLDSLGGYHTAYVERLVDKLDAHYGGEAFARRALQPPEQPSDWECGLYVLMYTWLLLRWQPETQLQAHTDKYLATLCEKNRRLFTQHLLQMIAA
jgi:hypothetical protein